MERQGEPDLRQFAQEHHVHYELEPELMGEGEERSVVGFDVRLFATHEEARLEAPACPRCVALAADLRAFAERVVSGGDAQARTEIVPAEPVLYESAEVPGSDEVPITVRVRFDAPVRAAAGAAEDHRLRELQTRLEALGVPRR
jgi:hypothetical protein